MKSVSGIAILLLPALSATLVAHHASAAPADAAPEPPDARPRSLPPLSVDGAFGVALRREPEESGYGAYGVSVLARPSWLTLGGTLEVNDEITIFGGKGHTRYFAGALGGATAPVTDWFAVETLGELGLQVKQSGDVFHHEATNDVVTEENATTLPYAGLRLAPTFTVARVRLAPWGLVRQDLGTATARYTTTECATECTSQAGSREVGGTHFAFGISAGVALTP